jgi:hypothetical protein
MPGRPERNGVNQWKNSNAALNRKTPKKHLVRLRCRVYPKVIGWPWLGFMRLYCSGIKPEQRSLQSLKLSYLLSPGMMLKTPSWISVYPGIDHRDYGSSIWHSGYCQRNRYLGSSSPENRSEVATHKQGEALIYSLIEACQAIEVAWNRISTWLESQSSATYASDSSFYDQLATLIEVGKIVLGALL